VLLSRKETRELDALAQWQIEEIEKGIAEADRGEFVSDQEVAQALKRWMRVRPTSNC
jgi:predicted transcriptional regulator